MHKTSPYNKISHSGIKSKNTSDGRIFPVIVNIIRKGAPQDKIRPLLYVHRRRSSALCGLSVFCTKTLAFFSFSWAFYTIQSRFSPLKLWIFAAFALVPSKISIIFMAHITFSQSSCNFFLAKLHLDVYNFGIINLESVPKI